MIWPTMSDYQDALQTPRLSFSDPELRRGVPVTDRLGLPKPITGGFASVYQVNCDGRKWAVRCFIRYHQDTAQRYVSIGRYLENARLPYMAGFQFLTQGVRVHGQWYPMLKMEWVDGDPLNTYVERYRGDSLVMRRLAEQFARMTRDLREAGIAHGDLQHGNIMVVGNSLRLVDYDGMFIPPLRGMPSHEIGHPNYQHPRRSDRDFGPHLDNFAAWVIHLSLAALSFRPDLWDIAGGGDEQLLFTQKDFIDPRASRVLRALDELPDETLRQMVSSFKALLGCSDIAQIPPVDGSKVILPVSSRTYAVDIPAPARPLQRNGSLPEWVWDHIGSEQVELGPPFAAERATAGCSLLVMVVLGRFASLGYFAPWVAAWGSAAGVVAAVVVAVMRYRRRPEFIRKSSLLTQVKGAKREVRRLEAAIKRAERDRERLVHRHDLGAKDIEERLKDLEAQEREEGDQVDAWLRRYTTGLLERREALNRAEADELAKAAKSTPLRSLSKRASAIMRYYRGKRDPLLKQEQRALLEAAKKKDSVRAKYAQRREPFEKKLHETRQSFENDVGVLDGRVEQESQQISLQKWSLRNLEREVLLYDKVTFIAFLRRVFFIRD